jgi:hypothetical protein
VSNTTAEKFMPFTSLKIKVRIKGEVVPVPKHYTMKVYQGRRHKDLHILNLSTGWR